MKRLISLFKTTVAAGAFIFAAVGPVSVAAKSFYTPELSVYMSHNDTFRSRVGTNATYVNQDERFSTAAFEYDLDIGLMPFFRRYLYKTPDAEKSKRFSMRLGYIYLPDIATGSDETTEHRALGDLTARFPLGRAGLLSDRNRFEYRNVGDNDSTRYRNRPRYERSFRWGGLKSTPYIGAEFYYDRKRAEWNQTDFNIGTEFPWRYSTIMEIYYTRSYNSSAEDNETFGLTLQKHL